MNDEPSSKTIVNAPKTIDDRYLAGTVVTFGCKDKYESLNVTVMTRICGVDANWDNVTQPQCLSLICELSSHMLWSTSKFCPFRKTCKLHFRAPVQ